MKTYLINFYLYLPEEEGINLTQNVEEETEETAKTKLINYYNSINILYFIQINYITEKL